MFWLSEAVAEMQDYSGPLINLSAFTPFITHEQVRSQQHWLVNGVTTSEYGLEWNICMNSKWRHHTVCMDAQLCPLQGLFVNFPVITARVLEL